MEDRYPQDAWDLTEKIIRQICRSVTLDRYQQEEFQSTKYKKQKPLNLKKFGERWIEIKSRLCGTKIVDPPINCIMQLKCYFAALQVPFDRLIYKVARNNFINYNLVYTIGLELTGYECFKEFFPPPTGKEVLLSLCNIMYRLFTYLGWPLTPTIVRHASLADKSAACGQLRFAASEIGYIPVSFPQADLQ